MNSVVDGTITKTMIGKNARNEACMESHLLEHFKDEGHSGFPENVSIAIIDKADDKYPKKTESY